MIKNPVEAFSAYLKMTDRLPKLSAQSLVPVYLSEITDLIDDIDVFFFDGYGVLNVGLSAIPRAVENVHKLQEANKGVFVVTNAATQDMPALMNKYKRMGFNFKPWQVINSREVMLEQFLIQPDLSTQILGVISPPDFRPVTTYQEVYPEDPKFWQADQFLFLSTLCWNESLQQQFVKALDSHPRPVWVGNVDLIAPLEHGVSREPGSYTLMLDERLFEKVNCFGKPFQPIFEKAMRRAKEHTGITDLNRMVMVGDTLHTDILGGAIMGMKTVLVTGSGFLRGLNVEEHIDAADIKPSYILDSI
ncbi:MAG: hypothetical protein CENE_03499 [Candidatus Celerinatantimonas neptuna]|nr:MAG: hypothetical protein CENE_03499 [Candidatus Celerinatantimonas neptuna]